MKLNFVSALAFVTFSTIYCNVDSKPIGGLIKPKALKILITPILWIFSEYPRAILVTGSDFLNCKGTYYITNETTRQTSNLPIYKLVESERYIYYRSGPSK